MAAQSKTRGAFKFAFWTAVSLALLATVIHSYTSGQMAAWYYYTAAADGYAVNAKEFTQATRENPALLAIGSFERIEGLQAVRVKKGERLPRNANGLILDDVLQAGDRAVLEGDRIKVAVPWEMLDAKGFKFKDTFQHKGIRTNPWAAAWNVSIVIGLGLALGYMAEGLTDMLGIRITRIRHFENR